MLKTLMCSMIIGTLALSVPISSTVAGQSAIERALKQEETPTKLDKELIDRLNIFKGTLIDTKDFASFLEKIRTNTKLEEAFQKAKEQGVHIVVATFFSTSPEMVFVDGKSAEEKEVVSYIHSSISVALAKEQLRKDLEQPSKDFGVSAGVIDIEDFGAFIARVRENPELVEALQKAKEQGVRIIVAVFFSVSDHMIFVDMNRSDYEIIKYITG